VEVLVVCTANVCRSPYGEVVVADLLKSYGLDATVRSGGVRASIGEAACEAMWVDSGFTFPAGRTAQQVTPEDLDSVDFVLTFERAHRSDLISMRPSAYDHIFTFVEAASLAQYVVREGGPLDVATGRTRAASDVATLARVPLLPASPAERAQWFAREMAAARDVVATTPIDDAVLSADGESLVDPLFVEGDVHRQVGQLASDHADVWAQALARCVLYS
jgi:protein-tyrosine phosphatase